MKRAAVGSVAVALVVALGACAGPAPAGRGPAAESPTTAPTTTAPTTPARATPTPTSTTVPAPVPGGALLAAALADARAARWVHATLTSVLPASAGGRSRSVQVAGPGRGRQRYTVGGLTLSVLVLGPVTYVRGSARALEVLASEPAALARPVAGRWLALTAADPAYPSVTSGVGIASLLANLPSGTDPLERPGRLGGRSASVVVSRVPARRGGGTVTVWVSTGRRPLPLRVVEAGGRAHTVVAFGRWGRSVTLVPPASAVPMPEPRHGTDIV